MGIPERYSGTHYGVAERSQPPLVFFEMLLPFLGAGWVLASQVSENKLRHLGFSLN
jgi:hypothetical protein